MNADQLATHSPIQCWTLNENEGRASAYNRVNLSYEHWNETHVCNADQIEIYHVWKRIFLYFMIFLKFGWQMLTVH